MKCFLNSNDLPAEIVQFQRFANVLPFLPIIIHSQQKDAGHFNIIWKKWGTYFLISNPLFPTFQWVKSTYFKTFLTGYALVLVRPKKRLISKIGLKSSFLSIVETFISFLLVSEIGSQNSVLALFVGLIVLNLFHQVRSNVINQYIQIDKTDLDQRWQNLFKPIDENLLSQRVSFFYLHIQRKQFIINHWNIYIPTVIRIWLFGMYGFFYNPYIIIFMGITYVTLKLIKIHDLNQPIKRHLWIKEQAFLNGLNQLLTHQNWLRKTFIFDKEKKKIYAEIAGFFNDENTLNKEKNKQLIIGQIVGIITIILYLLLAKDVVYLDNSLIIITVIWIFELQRLLALNLEGHFVFLFA